MKNKGFTLVELLVAVVVLGIIIGLSFPVIRNIQRQNDRKKYETYAEGMMTSARLYVNSYDEDMFGHHDTGCAYITYQEFLEKELIKDVPISDISCDSENTFVRVVKLKNQYGYSYSLGCGKEESGVVENATMLLPEEGNHTMDPEVCRGPEGSNIKISLKHSTKISRRVKSKITIESPTGLSNDIVIYYTWIKGDDPASDENDWKRASFTVPTKQEEMILNGEIIQVESEDIVSPEGDGEWNLWIRVDELKDLFGEEWKNLEEDSRYLHQGPFHLDNTKPTCKYSGEAKNQNDWKKGNRVVTVSCEDNGEGASGCKTKDTLFTFAPDKFMKEGSITHTIEDNAGNKTSCNRNNVLVYVDNEAPTCTLTGPSSTWTNANRTITWGCDDHQQSGCATGYSGSSKSFTTTTKTANIASYEIRDAVGNKRTCPAQNNVNVYVDKTAPTCTSGGDSTTWVTGSRTITWGCSDADSGCDPNASGGSKVFNTYTQTATIPSYVIKDKVGNSTTCPARTANVYVRQEFAITYVLNGGTCANCPKKYIGNYNAVSIPNPTRANYTFAGWYTNASFTGSSVNQIPKNSTGAKTFYAKWVFTATQLKARNPAGLTSSLVGGMYRYQGTESASTNTNGVLTGGSHSVNNFVCFGTSDKNTCVNNPSRFMYRIIGIDSSGQAYVIKKTYIAREYWYRTYPSSIQYWPSSVIKASINGSTFLTNSTYLPSGWAGKIASVNWKYGKYVFSNVQTRPNCSSFYNTTNGFSSSINAKIGLMYPHDFACAISSGTVSGSSWIHGSHNTGVSSEWTIATCVGSGGQAPVDVCETGSDSINHTGPDDLSYIRPTFYIVSSALYTGSGTPTDPFVIVN